MRGCAIWAGKAHGTWLPKGHTHVATSVAHTCGNLGQDLQAHTCGNLGEDLQATYDTAAARGSKDLQASLAQGQST